MTERLEKITRCLYQVFRPKKEIKGILRHNPGWGVCEHCVYDKKNNPKCEGYTPITLYKNKRKE